MEPILIVFAKSKNVYFAQIHIENLRLDSKVVVHFICQCLNALIYTGVVTDPRASLICFITTHTDVIAVRASRVINSKITIREMKQLICEREKYSRLFTLSVGDRSLTGPITVQELQSIPDCCDNFLGEVLKQDFNNIINIYSIMLNV
jgi:hypothetical protein